MGFSTSAAAAVRVKAILNNNFFVMMYGLIWWCNISNDAPGFSERFRMPEPLVKINDAFSFTSTPSASSNSCIIVGVGKWLRPDSSPFLLTTRCAGILS